MRLDKLLVNTINHADAVYSVTLKKYKINILAGEEGKKMMADNARMVEELKFLHSVTTELQTDKVFHRGIGCCKFRLICLTFIVFC